MQPNLKSDDEVWIAACGQYNALVNYCSENNYEAGSRYLEQTGVMRLAARFGFRELIAREAHERLAELTATQFIYANVVVPVATPVIEAVKGLNQSLPGIPTASLMQRVDCIKDLLEVEPEAANIPDFDGGMPLEIASELNETFYVEAILPYVKDINAGRKNALYYAVLNERTAPEGIQLHKARGIRDVLMAGGGVLRKGEIVELCNSLENGNYAHEIYSGRQPQYLLTPGSP